MDRTATTTKKPLTLHWKRYVAWMLVIGLVLTITLMSVRPRPQLVDRMLVSRGPMDVRVEEDGQTRIREKYIVSTPLAARLSRITLDVGDHVVGDSTVIARLEATDPALLDPRATAQAKARVRAAERKLELARAELVKAEAEVQFAESEMGRVRQMMAGNAASRSQLETREMLFRTESEEARAAGFAVDIAEYELELEKAALLLTSANQESDTEMTLSIQSPIDGRVLRIYQESSAVVQAGAPLLELGDPTDLEVVADVLSRDAVRISAGDLVELKHWGGDFALVGRVRLVEPSGFTKVSALGVEEQRVNVIIDLEDPPADRQQLGDGFRVDCEVVIWEEDDVLQVPTSALFRVDGNWNVFTMDTGRAHRKAVKIGQNNGRFAQVLEGLSEGEAVIVHPSDSLEDDSLVKKR
ncbi:MAG: efflux RND transporter periplasmic adaptor subunit [Planctomycetota bacterium]